jgi:cytochrome c oxidase subunit III
MEQQKEASSLGMWLFLVTEIMFFGGMFTGYLVYRIMYFNAFVAGSNTLDITLGAINTAVLIISSLTMAMGVHAAQLGKRKALCGFIILTMIFGGIFLGIKAVEYADKFEHHHIPGKHFQWVTTGEHALPPVDPGQAQIYFSFYFAMTGMHALHMVIGFGLLTWLLIMSWKGTYGPEYHTPVENLGLYWHFVDIVWIFLFPLLYLISRHPQH